MKKYLIISALAAVSHVHAADANNVGCGWGSMVFDGKSDKGSQVLAATTNGTFGNQTFGITSGTAGCAQNATVKRYAAVSSFMTANVDKVAHDMSIGQGESLDTMAGLMDMTDEHKATFFRLVKENFAAIFPNTSTTSEQALKSVSELMAKDAVLSQYTV
jgi:translation elongation factor EF-4